MSTSQNNFKKAWVDKQLISLKAVSTLSDKELTSFLETQFDENFKETPVLLATNLNDPKQLETDYLTEVIMTDMKDNVLSGQGSLFRPDTDTNLVGQINVQQIADRDVVKREMFAFHHDKGGIEFRNKNLEQGNIKINTNSGFGVLLEKSFILSNKLLGSAITYSGYLSSATLIRSVEQYFDNPFIMEIDELFVYLGRLREHIKSPKLKELITMFEPVSRAVLVDRIHSWNHLTDVTDNFRFAETVQTFVKNLDDDEVSILYYVNNLEEILSSDIMLDFIDGIMETAITFLDSSSPPDAIKELCNPFKENILPFVMHSIPSTSTESVVEIDRGVVLVTDTDSIFVYLHKIITRIAEAYGINLEDEDEDSYYNIVVSVVYGIHEVISDYLHFFTSACNIPEEDRYMLSMKSELLYSSLLLTNAKKWYCGHIVLQEGNKSTEPELDVKGISLKKKSTPTDTSDALKNILSDDVLPFNNPVDVLRSLKKLSDNIHDEIMGGSVRFFTKANLNAAYAAPHTQAVWRGTQIWNAIQSELPDPDAIAAFDDVRIVKLTPAFEEFVNEEVETSVIAAKVNRATRSDEKMKGKMNVIAIPLEATLPEELLKFIDTSTIVDDNLNTFSSILEALGFAISSTTSTSKEQYRCVRF